MFWRCCHPDCGLPSLFPVVGRPVVGREAARLNSEERGDVACSRLVGLWGFVNVSPSEGRGRGLDRPLGLPLGDVRDVAAAFRRSSVAFSQKAPYPVPVLKVMELPTEDRVLALRKVPNVQVRPLQYVHVHVQQHVHPYPHPHPHLHTIKDKKSCHKTNTGKKSHEEGGASASREGMSSNNQEGTK